MRVDELIVFFVIGGLFLQSMRVRVKIMDFTLALNHSLWRRLLPKKFYHALTLFFYCAILNRSRLEC